MKKVKWTTIMDIIDDIEYWVDIVEDIMDDDAWDVDKEEIISKIMAKYNSTWIPDILEAQVYSIILDIVRRAVIKQIERSKE